MLLDTQSQTSAVEMEASVESNPAGASPMAAAHSSRSSSPMAHLSKLQSDVHLAVNSIFTAKRSSDLEIQRVVQDFEAWHYARREVEMATANKKARVTHSQEGFKG